MENYVSAALAVLGSFEQPLTAKEITTEAIDRGLLESKGRTPHVTMSARLYVFTRQHPDGPIVRLYAGGEPRARRGSVRWMLRRI